jgi:hypothetical protein
MSWTLFVQIMVMMTWGAVMARYVVAGNEARPKKGPDA